MKLQLAFPKTAYPFRINYQQAIFFVGSCFTENINHKLSKHYFRTYANPSGILFDPKSIVRSLTFYLQQEHLLSEKLFYHQELWRSWQHHTQFAHPEQKVVCNNINAAHTTAHEFLKKASYLFITLGSAFSYYLVEGNHYVANCHQYPQQKFQKKLIVSSEIVEDFTDVFKELFAYNPSLKILLNISPVRHIRDGVVENNRSKANLLEATHRLVENYPQQVFYFPSYEIVIDVLRDYRYYDIDLVHPNYLATEIVFDYFQSSLLDRESQQLIQEIEPILSSLHHQSLHPTTQLHQEFLSRLAKQIQLFEKKYVNIMLLPKNKTGS